MLPRKQDIGCTVAPLHSDIKIVDEDNSNFFNCCRVYPISCGWMISCCVYWLNLCLCADPIMLMSNLACCNCFNQCFFGESMVPWIHIFPDEIHIFSGSSGRLHRTFFMGTPCSSQPKRSNLTNSEGFYPVSIKWVTPIAGWFTREKSHRSKCMMTGGKPYLGNTIQIDVENPPFEMIFEGNHAFSTF